MRRKSSRAGMMFSCIIFLVLIVFLLVVFLSESSKNPEPEKADTPEQVYDTENGYDTGNSTEEEDVLMWKGESYRYNEHLSNYLFLGVDEYELEESQNGQMQAGQCDALFLLSYDRVAGSMAVISIPRDTMTDIQVLLPDGTSAGYSRDHISLAYSYGDGSHESCRLAKEAVSGLFYGLPVQGYCALSMSGLEVIPEVIGSFEVTLPNDSLSVLDPSYGAGDVYVVSPDSAETFVRYRDVETSQSALDRLERQQSFLKAAMAQMEVQYGQDAGIVTELYEALTPYMVTSMGNDVFAKLAECAYAGGEVLSWTVPGEGSSGDRYDEYLVDDDALYEKMIDTFYVRVGK